MPLMPKRVKYRKVLRAEPNTGGAGNEIVFDVSEAQVPAAFRKAVEEGVSDALMTGVLGNFAIIDTKIGVIGGEARDTESSEMAFRSAAVMALRAVVNASGPVLLEPISTSCQFATPLSAH